MIVDEIVKTTTKIKFGLRNEDPQRLQSQFDKIKMSWDLKSPTSGRDLVKVIHGF
jgi:hypothetical protein